MYSLIQTPIYILRLITLIYKNTKYYEYSFLFQTQQIPDSAILFDQFKKQTISFSYFQVDRKYYLFFYAEKYIELDFLYQSVDVIQELDSKQRKISSFRSFLSMPVLWSHFEA